MDKNEEAFNKLLASLEPDIDPPERYKQLRFKMIKFFQWKHCGDVEILADETIARALKNIFEGYKIEADDPYIYIRAVAINVYREYVRKEIKTRTLIANLLQLPIESKVSEVSEDCGVQCLQKLHPDKLKLLQEYFLDEKSSEQIAEELGTTINGLRLQVHRIKKGLNSCYKECIKKLSRS
jgi:RNA polymerase sigma factor (sigma-70 family)